MTRRTSSSACCEAARGAAPTASPGRPAGRRAAPARCATPASAYSPDDLRAARRPRTPTQVRCADRRQRGVGRDPLGDRAPCGRASTRRRRTSPTRTSGAAARAGAAPATARARPRRSWAGRTRRRTSGRRRRAARATVAAPPGMIEAESAGHAARLGRRHPCRSGARRRSAGGAQRLGLPGQDRAPTAARTRQHARTRATRRRRSTPRTCAPACRGASTRSWRAQGRRLDGVSAELAPVRRGARRPPRRRQAAAAGVLLLGLARRRRRRTATRSSAAAAALELLQACALIHDDVMDGSRHPPRARPPCTAGSRRCTAARLARATASAFGDRRRDPARRPVPGLGRRAAVRQRACPPRRCCAAKPVFDRCAPS